MPSDHEQSMEYTTEQPSEKSRPTPLPKMQIFILMMVMFAEPISSTVIYPFVNQFVKDTGIINGDEKKIGYYAGLLEAVFFFAECATVLQWGRLSDSIGRRPVLLLGPLGLAASLFAYGSASNFWTLLVARCLQGAFNGNIGVTKTMVAEITDYTNIAQAYAWLPVMWSSGITLGPLIGGFFTQPAQRWPELSHITFLVNHPYFAPCAITGTLSLVSFIIAYVGLKETLPSKLVRPYYDPKGDQPPSKSIIKTDCGVTEGSPLLPDQTPRKYGSNECNDHLNETPTTQSFGETEALPLRKLINRPLLIALANHGFLCFMDQAFQALLPLMYSTSIPLGGLSRKPNDIGMIMGVWGALNAVGQVPLSNRMMRWLGPRKMYTVCFSSFLIIFSAFPIMSMFARLTGNMGVMVWGGVCFQMAFYTLVLMAYSCMPIYIIDAAPTRNSLGAVNALGQMTSSVTRTVASCFATSLFSISLQEGLMGGYFVYLVLLTMTSVGIFASFSLPRKMRSTR